MTVESAQDYLTMSDEDFDKLSPPDSDEGESTSVDSSEEEETIVEEDSTKVEEETSQEGSEGDTINENLGSTDEEPGEATNVPVEDSEAEVDLKEFYDSVLGPIKANGKTIQLKTKEEAIQMIQQGANYTKRMQEIAPYRKLLVSLEKNGLLDEDKLNYLIDLDKKNPEAIKKLIEDSKLDRWELANDEEPVNYQKPNHMVNDAEANFYHTLEEVKSLDGGMEALQTINNNWDVKSKDALVQNPEIMETIREQYLDGTYQTIANEVARLTMLGQIPTDAPFLSAYEQVGAYLQEVNKVKNPIARKTGTANVARANNLAKQASSPKGENKKTNQIIPNPLTMSDEEFEKQAAFLLQMTDRL